MNYQIKVAKLFKNLENKKSIGAIIGKVIEPCPNLTISILEGQITLYPEQLYINTLLTDTYVRDFEIEQSEFELTGDKFSLTASPAVIMDTTPTSSRPVSSIPEGQTSSVEIGGKADQSGQIKLVDTLKNGDLVKVTPTINEQIWFVDYIVKKVTE